MFSAYKSKLYVHQCFSNEYDHLQCCGSGFCGSGCSILLVQGLKGEKVDVIWAAVYVGSLLRYGYVKVHFLEAVSAFSGGKSKGCTICCQYLHMTPPVF